ncbi:MAG: NADH-quinone oxidoreductase subunit J [Candidatus Rokubacteria bacterium]|nr:NADH-quinone oxidoreductase subunit J [Chloroflexota bacterium]MBM4441869.1 NADH-quinone oxidoreductase subunit J [Candidatus Rokubacteria bacterium]
MLDRLPLPSQFDRIIVQGSIVAGMLGTPILVVLLALLLLSRISAPEFVFWLDATVVIAGALGAVLLRNIVHAALALIATLLGVAGIFLLLANEFIALVQVLVYGGGVTILLLFGLMLTNAQDEPVVSDGSQKPFAFGVAVIIGGLFIAAVIDANWGARVPAVVSFTAFGERLFRDFLIPVILIAILLDIALSGAFVNARRSRDEDEMAPTGGEARS